MRTEGTQEELYQKNNDMQLLVLENAQMRSTSQQFADYKISTHEKLISMEKDNQRLTKAIESLKMEKEEMMHEKVNALTTSEDVKVQIQRLQEQNQRLEDEKKTFCEDKKDADEKYSKLSDEVNKCQQVN